MSHPGISAMSGTPARVSVLIGLVSTEDGDRILETLAALKAAPEECEIVLADRRQDEVSRSIAERYPDVRLVSCARETTLPEMRTIALDASSGGIVAVTEDHCVPGEGWIAEILKAFETPGTVAVGGNVDNGVRDTGFDWATFLCEYSFFYPPVQEGVCETLPGMNVAYRRDALLSVPRDRLNAGFWETTVHPLLLAQGKFVSRNAIRMHHCKKFSLGLFVRQRYVYSRYYAGIRFGKADIARRLAASILSLALPPLLLWRMFAAASRKRLRAEFARAFPALSLFVLVWAAGEMVGYLAGSGRALVEIE